MNDTTPLLTVKEAAERLSCSATFVRRLVERTRKGVKGGIQFCQINNNGPVRFRPEWIDALIQSNTQTPSETLPHDPIPDFMKGVKTYW
jgi:excisionase family DNA binding protein